MVLDLQNTGGDLGVGQEVVDELGVEVGNADAPDKPVGVLGGLDELLQSSPGLRNGNLGQWGDLGLLLVGPEAREAHLLEGNEFEGDGEVDEEQVEVAQPPGLVLQLGLLMCVLALVVVVPELAGDEDVLALDDALVDGATNALAGLGAVGVVPCAVDVAVAQLDGVVDL